MIALPTTNAVLRIITTAAVALDVHATYVDSTPISFLPGWQNTTISTATTTTVISAPGSGGVRTAKFVSLHARGGGNTVTVEVFDGSNAYRLVSVTLAIGESLRYEDAHGWRAFTAAGEIKQATTLTLLGRQTHAGWAPTAAGQTSNLLTVVAAGHTPGFYLVAIEQLVTTSAASALGQETVSWSDGGARSIATGTSGANGALAWSATGMAFNTGRSSTNRSVYSDGISAITAQVTAQGAFGTPVIDVSATAVRISN